MRPWCLLCRLGATMAWTGSRFFDWFWGTLGHLWRCLTRICLGVLGFGRRLALTWRGDEGNEDENTEDTYSDDMETSSDLPEEPPYGWERPAESRQQVLRYQPEEEEGDGEEYRVETSDEFYCVYDSTWETEEDEEDEFRRSKRLKVHRNYKFTKFERAARDMQRYRKESHDQVGWHQRRGTSSNKKPNLDFYLGKIPSKPDGVYIQEFHEHWYGQYDALEYVHSYIQWLFPLQEQGMNYDACPLTREEVKDFCENKTAKKHLLMSYKLMLDFYGIELCNEKTGEVRRASNWRDRFNNLNSHSHNNLRITRILKSLGILGYGHYQAPLVRFFLEETLVNGRLPNVTESVLNYFVFAVLDSRERRKLIKVAFLSYSSEDEFVWCPKKIQQLWSSQTQK